MDTSQDLGYLLHHLSAVLARQSDQVLQEQLGIGFSQFKILLMLEQKGVLQQREIAVRLGQTEASVSRQVKLLQTDGMLVSQVSPNNRRQHITRLTPKGTRVLMSATDILNRYHYPVFSKLSDRQQQQLRELLTVMHQATCNTTNH